MTGNLALQLFRDGVVLGTALLPDLHLRTGNNTISATSAFQVGIVSTFLNIKTHPNEQANNSPQGLQTLNDFVGKKGWLSTLERYCHY